MQLFTFYVVSKTKTLHTLMVLVDPFRDKEKTIDIELQLKDLDTVRNVLINLRKRLKLDKMRIK